MCSGCLLLKSARVGFTVAVSIKEKKDTMRDLIGSQNTWVYLSKFAEEFNVSRILLGPDEGGLTALGIGF